jgi:hypothetical protein
MKSTKRGTFLLCWCLIVMVPISGWSQSQALPTLPESREKNLALEEYSRTIKKQIEERGTGKKAKVKITLRDKTERRGYISQINADSFQVTDEKTGKVATLSYDAVDQVKGEGLSRGAKIGIWVGVVGAGVAIVLGLLAHTLNHS